MTKVVSPNLYEQDNTERNQVVCWLYIEGQIGSSSQLRFTWSAWETKTNHVMQIVQNFIILLCLFHIQQAAWRFIVKAKNLVRQKHWEHVFQLLNVFPYSKALMILTATKKSYWKVKSLYSMTNYWRTIVATYKRRKQNNGWDVPVLKMQRVQRTQGIMEIVSPSMIMLPVPS